MQAVRRKDFCWVEEKKISYSHEIPPSFVLFKRENKNKEKNLGQYMIFFNFLFIFFTYKSNL